jgi:preprotein translocase subunit SecE
VNRQTKRLLQRQGQLDAEGSPTVGSRRPPPPSQRRPPAPDRPGLPQRAVEFAREVRNELAKVAWPSRGEVVNYALVVFVTLILITSLVFGLDYGFAKGVIALFG